MRWFIDTEFDEDGKTIELISLAMVCEDGRELYMVSSEFDPDKCNDWVKKNVLPLLPPEDARFTRKRIADEVELWTINDQNLEFWADYASYDWVVFCQLFGTMMQLPKGFPMYCNDIQQLAKSKGINTEKLSRPRDGEAVHNALHDARNAKRVYEYLKGAA